MSERGAAPTVPELLAPAGSLEAVRAAIANGADAVYLGAERFNARDEGAQLTLDELETACRLAHERSRRIYLTLNTLVKPAELQEALELLGSAIDRGIDAAIVQDVGLIRLIAGLYPDFELHGSTQLTVHDESGARVAARLGLSRVVLARENTLDDIRSIREAVPDLGIETFVHGALCISYSGQCYMSGMISERSANRGSCAQSCRKGYRLFDVADDSTLDDGFLISARDLAAVEHLPAIAAAGIVCVKIEGRKKRPEYVATATRTYRDFIDGVRAQPAAPAPPLPADLVQIYSRGFTGGMSGGRAGRDYVTRKQPDNRGVEVGVVVGGEKGALIVDVSERLVPGDGVTIADANGVAGEIGFRVTAVSDVPAPAGIVRQRLRTETRAAAGSAILRNSSARLLDQARSSYDAVPEAARHRKVRVDAWVSGEIGARLTLRLLAGEVEATAESGSALAKAERRALDTSVLRAHVGRLGDTDFVLGSLDSAELDTDAFLPLSELNQLRREAVERLQHLVAQVRVDRLSVRSRAIADAIAGVSTVGGVPAAAAPFDLQAEVFSLDAARVAAGVGATCIVLDPFLRHPAPPPAKVQSLRNELETSGISLQLRTPSIVRPEDRYRLDRYLALETPVVTGHMGLVAELAGDGRAVTADYAVNCFNQHSAAFLFQLGARCIVPSVELTSAELRELVAPWEGAGFTVFLHGRPEGMTLEHCVLSAAFDREPTTCRDLCVQRHANVAITDPAGYSFPVATDSDCRNRLLHSRPLDGAEFLNGLWRSGLRSFKLVFNTADAPVAEVTSGYRRALDALVSGQSVDSAAIRAPLAGEFTRGHFARAV